MQVSPKMVQVLALPALLTLGFVGQDGSASPLDSAPKLPLKLSASSVPFGSKVTVTGVALALEPGAKIHVTMVGGGSQNRRVAIGSVSRSHSWKASFSAIRSGHVAAVPSDVPITSVAGSSGYLPALKVTSQVSVPSALGGKVGSSPKLRGRVTPAGSYRIVAERFSGGRWEVVSRSTTSATGAYAIAVSVGEKPSKVRVRSLNRRSLGGGASRSVRVSSMRPALASWYDLYGNGVACGGVLRRETMGVAHKTLKCGTKVTITYRGRTVTVPVIDRGPYIAGREFDLTGATARALGFDGVGTVWVSN